MKKLKKLLFNRIVITSLLMFIQVGFIMLEVFKLGRFYIPLAFLLRCISVGVTFYLIYKPMNPEMKIGWIVPVLIFPLFGGIIFLLYGHVIVPVKLRNNLSKVNRAKIKGYNWKKDRISQLEKENFYIANQCRYIEDYGGTPVYQNTEATYFKEGKDYFKEVVAVLKTAKKFIFIESFIIKPGKMWDEVLEILSQKVKQGIEVRVMYDDVGSAFSLPNDYTERLEKQGIQSVVFNKLSWIVTLVLNNRDHRKVIVVDGKTAFTGGINIADEYIDEKHPFGHWKDAGIKIEGEGVWSFTVMFLQMWNIVRPTEENYLPYKVEIQDSQYEDGYIQPYASEPLREERLGETVCLNMIDSAKQSIYIYTPYLIIDYNMITAFERAAKRGVDIRIVTPGVPDKKRIYWLTQSFYQRLLKAGVHIMQYKPGFIHSKCILCDGELASIGTINFDYRSFYHHFECSVLLYHSRACLQLKEDMEATFKQCEKIDLEWCKEHINRYAFQGIILKLLSPLL